MTRRRTRRLYSPGPAGRAAAVLSLVLVASTACEGMAGDPGKVVRVQDGDSVIVRQPEGQNLEVRLFGIDAPERRQPWSRRSRRALGNLVKDREVRVQVITEDAYGRTVAVLHRTSDGLDVNREMIRQGHAWVYRRYTDDPALLALEDAARAAGTGLWSLPEAERIPPWQWRRQNRIGGAGKR